ncbi:MAG TPA: hypothetical protein VNF48_00265 [Gammaproteobacteria bacterium]|nr:hypothetical protein [Gammaproteobacteria bacterium]
MNQQVLMLVGICSGLDAVDDEDLSGVTGIDGHRELSNVLYGS